MGHLAELYILSKNLLNPDTLQTLKNLNAAKLKYKQELKIKYNVLKLLKYVKKEQTKRFKQRVKRLLFIGISLGGAFFLPVFLPVKLAYAIEANPTVLEKVKGFIYEKNPEGEQKLNLKNICLASLGASILAMAIIFLGNEDNSYGFKRLFFKPEMIPNVISAALTIEEKEYIHSIRQQSLQDIKAGKILVTTITMLPAIRHMLSTSFNISQENKNKILTSFLRVFFCSVSLGNKLVEYDVLNNDTIQHFPQLTGIVGREISYTTNILRNQQKEFLGMITQILGNEPLLNIALDYLNYHKLDALIKQKDIQFNATLLKDTVVDLIQYYDQKTANTTN